MAEGAPPKDGSAAAPSPPKLEGNPAFRAMGLPRISKWKLPSRNWLIFLGITGSWTTALLYDRYRKKRAQKKWCNFVSHLSEEPLPGNMMPRRITILLAGPPGDGLRPAREHFHEYIKPILVAGAIDWEVIEGRREGEVRAGLAERIRKLRKRRGERAPKGEEEDEEAEEDMVFDTRQKLGIADWDGVQGDLILGRHTWKEYIRGLHEGWLGPLKDPSPAQSRESLSEEILDLPINSTPSPSSELSLDASSTPTQETESPEATLPSAEAEKPPEKSRKPSHTPAYISTEAYPTTATPPTLPPTLGPSLPLQLPHLLGLKHTPIRLYRFLTRRYLAEDTGAQVAALVFATRSRPYTQSASFVSAADPDDNSASSSSATVEVHTVVAGEAWEQEKLLMDEEAGWHKSAWKKEDTKEGEEKKERVWIDKIVMDPRIGGRMRAFELDEEAKAKATEQAEEMRRKEPWMVEKVTRLIGWEKQGKKGWEMGLEGDEFS